MVHKNQMLDSMLRAAKDRLLRHDPMEIALNADVNFDGKMFQFDTLGTHVGLSYPEFEPGQELSQWHILPILHYLDLADGTSLSGELMPFAGYREGMVRGEGFDRDAERIIRDRLGKLEHEVLKRRCLELGATILPSNADFCAKLDFMPRYSLWLKMWFADEEFPASGRILIDGNAAHYLSVEDAVTVGSLVLHFLEESRKCN